MGGVKKIGYNSHGEATNTAAAMVIVNFLKALILVVLGKKTGC
jgi:hypothetical protein